MSGEVYIRTTDRWVTLSQLVKSERVRVREDDKWRLITDVSEALEILQQSYRYHERNT